MKKTAGIRSKLNQNSKISLADLITEPPLRPLASSIRVPGNTIGTFRQLRNLHAAELAHLMGANSSALYNRAASSNTLTAGTSVLLRCYAVLPEYAQPLFVPTPADLVEAIKKIQKDFTPAHLGPLLGLEPNSSRRLRKNFNHASQSVKVLAHFIWQAIHDNPSNWWIIKACIETEAMARGIEPGYKVWTDGGWTAQTKE